MNKYGKLQDILKKGNISDVIGEADPEISPEIAVRDPNTGENISGAQMNRENQNIHEMSSPGMSKDMVAGISNLAKSLSPSVSTKQAPMVDLSQAVNAKKMNVLRQMMGLS